MTTARSVESGRSPFLFLLNSLEVGGSEKKTVAVANALHRRGWPVHLAYLSGPHTLLASCEPELPTVFLDREGRLDLAAVRRLRAYCKRHGITHIHCVNSYPTLFGALAAPALPGGRRGYTALINSTKLHGWRERLKMFVYRPLLLRAQKVIFGCRLQRDLWVKQYRLDGDNCGYLYNGVDSTRFDRGLLPQAQKGLRAELGWAENEVVVGMVGQLLPKKGYKDFLHACGRLLALGLIDRVLIVGDGPEKEELVRLIADLRIGNSVAFLGQVADVRPALYAMDMFVLSSVAVETFSNAALEAMAMGLPVVLSDIGGATEMVEDGANGFVYPAGDVDALVQRLRCLALDADLRQRFADAARRTVLERFSFERMVKDYEKLLLTSGRVGRTGSERIGPALAEVAKQGSAVDSIG